MGKKNKKKNRNRNKGNNNQNQNNNFNHQNEYNQQTNDLDHGADYPMDNNVYDAEKIEDTGSSKKNVITVIVVIALAVILTTLILLTTGLLKRENLSFLNFADNNFASATLNNESDNKESVEFVNRIEELRETKGTKPKSGLATFSYVNIPVLMNDSYSIADNYEKAGCDSVYWIRRYVEPTPAPLNATLREMFSYDQKLDFYVGNYAAGQSNLEFDYAEIENRVAKIYLTGSVSEDNSDCDRLRNQISQATLQFNTIGAVEIYLNGELY
jgi:hypothetical protein